MRPEPRRPAPEDIERAVLIAAKFSDRGEAGLRAWAAHFCAAHYRQPYGLSIEVGTNIGGSALLFCQLLELMYGPAPSNIPSLWTVDPYGSKPYVGGHGDSAAAQPPIYTDDFYQAMKHNLHGAPYHAHWLMTAADFFERMYALPYWRPGPEMFEAKDVRTLAPMLLPIGERRVAQNASFILLDGEHAAASIRAELLGRGVNRGAESWLGPRGTIVIDNIDTDPATLHMLTTVHGRDGLHLDLTAREWAVVTRVQR